MGLAGMMSAEEAIRVLRSDLRYRNLIHDSYLDPDILESAERFFVSSEFHAVVEILAGRLPNARIVDVGAGRGISSYAFARMGCRFVCGVEPDPSGDCGYHAIEQLGKAIPIQIVSALGEYLPFRQGAIDLVYARQALHHSRDLRGFVHECARILRPGGWLLACREHVVDNSAQLEQFLREHPMHRLTGSENAFRLEDYLGAIRVAGLSLKKVFGPWTTVINAFPRVRSGSQLHDLAVTLLEERFGRMGRWATLVPGVRWMIRRRLERPDAGRMYSFLAVKE